MTIAIDKVRTGQQIRLLMEKRGVTVRDVKNALSLACVQSVYHWLDGQSMPTLDNLYALSDLLKVPMDMLVYGNLPLSFGRSLWNVVNISLSKHHTPHTVMLPGDNPQL